MEKASVSDRGLACDSQSWAQGSKVHMANQRCNRDWRRYGSRSESLHSLLFRRCLNPMASITTIASSICMKWLSLKVFFVRLHCRASFVRSRVRWEEAIKPWHGAEQQWFPSVREQDLEVGISVE